MFKLENVEFLDGFVVRFDLVNVFSIDTLRIHINVPSNLPLLAKREIVIEDRFDLDVIVELIINTKSEEVNKKLLINLHEEYYEKRRLMDVFQVDDSQNEKTTMIKVYVSSERFEEKVNKFIENRTENEEYISRLYDLQETPFQFISFCSSDNRIHALIRQQSDSYCSIELGFASIRMNSNNSEVKYDCIYGECKILDKVLSVIIGQPIILPILEQSERLLVISPTIKRVLCKPLSLDKLDNFHVSIHSDDFVIILYADCSLRSIGSPLVRIDKLMRFKEESLIKYEQSEYQEMLYEINNDDFVDYEEEQHRAEVEYENWGRYSDEEKSYINFDRWVNEYENRKELLEEQQLYRDEIINSFKSEAVKCEDSGVKLNKRIAFLHILKSRELEEGSGNFIDVVEMLYFVPASLTGYQKHSLHKTYLVRSDTIGSFVGIVSGKIVILIDKSLHISAMHRKSIEEISNILNFEFQRVEEVKSSNGWELYESTVVRTYEESF